MTLAAWYLTFGALLLFMALTATRIKRLPLSTSIVYLCVGIGLGPTFAYQFHFNPLENSAFLEVFTEVAVIISLFGAGLKMGAPVGHRAWWVPFRLATVSMLITVGLTALVAVELLGISWGAAVLLGAIIAPTDPVLATDIQIKDHQDDDSLRFALTAEAGLNDGTAFPMVMLGLGLLGLHKLGDGFIHWALVDVVWATTIGLAIGGVLGALAAWSARKLAAKGMHSAFMEDFLGLGLIAVAYGTALAFHSYGFLAVFAAGFMLHRTEVKLRATNMLSEKLGETEEEQSRKNTASSEPYMALVSLAFVEQLERLGEVVMLILIGGMLFDDSWQFDYVAVAAILLLLVRPVSVFFGLLGSRQPTRMKLAIGWFGVRGIGSLYYLMYAIQHGLDEEIAVVLVSVVLVVVTLSVLLHGVTVTPLMRIYDRGDR